MSYQKRNKLRMNDRHVRMQFYDNSISARCCSNELCRKIKLNNSLMKYELKFNYLIPVPELRFSVIFLSIFFYMCDSFIYIYAHFLRVRAKI